MIEKCVLDAFISFRIRKIAEIENASKFRVGNRRCLPSCAPARRQRTPPPRGAARSRRPQTANPLAEVQRKTLRPLGTNTLTQFAHPAQPVQRKRLPPVRGEPAYAVRVPRSAGAEKKAAARTGRTRSRSLCPPANYCQKTQKPPYEPYGGFSMSYLVCWVIINTGMYQIS